MSIRLVPVVDRTFSQLIDDELERARSKFPEPETPPAGWTEHQLMHYWLGVIEEEFQEIKDLVFSSDWPTLGTPSDLLSELVQTATMCRRAAESCGLCKRG